MSQVMLVRAFGAVMVLGAVIMSTAVTSVRADQFCPTGIANFGDSLTDTGNALDAFPFFTDAENPPYGESFFGAPAERFCNGRLVIDFFAQAFKFPLLDAYFSVDSFNYEYGINFANAGATAYPVQPPPFTPFSLTPFQTSQFVRFKNSVAATQAQFGCFDFNPNLPQSTIINPNPLSTWLYTITAGGNDLLPPLEAGVHIPFINDTLVPQAVGAIAQAIITLHGNGARHFLVSGIPAAGCGPVVLTALEGQNYPKDNLGCLIIVNQVASNFGAQLLAEIKVLRTILTDASIAFFDYSSASYFIYQNAAAFGFNPSLILQTCCGAPGNGTYNYNPAVTCGHPAEGSNNCANPDTYLIWDGEHYTEAFYRIIAIFALNGLFTDGGVNYAASCNLDFSKFASGITFPQAYPFQTCNNLFT